LKPIGPWLAGKLAAATGTSKWAVVRTTVWPMTLFEVTYWRFSQTGDLFFTTRAWTARVFL
jgi:hypothetical protein